MGILGRALASEAGLPKTATVQSLSAALGSNSHVVEAADSSRIIQKASLLKYIQTFTLPGR